MTSSVEEMIGLYISAWNQTEVNGFKTGFAKCFAVDAAYTDPLFPDIHGVDELVELVLHYLELAPVRTFSVAVQPVHHHYVGLYTWKADVPGATREGYDYFEFNEEFKITRLVSFFGPLVEVGKPR